MIKIKYKNKKKGNCLNLSIDQSGRQDSNKKIQFKFTDNNDQNQI